LARALGAISELTYICFNGPGDEPLHAADLPFCREVITVPKPATYGPWQLLRGALGATPLPVLNYTCPAMSQAVDKASAQPFDLIHADSIHMIRYAEAVARAQPQALVVYNWHNIESEAMRRFAAATGTRAKAWYAGQTASKLEALELGILKTAQGHIVCSERERTSLLALVPDARIEVVENGVDVAGFRDIHTDQAQGNRLVFVGTMDYFPNVDAMTSFSTNIWPRLRERIPELTLSIVGANPAPQVLALAGIPGIEVTGTVPDVRPYYRNSLAAIVPLRTGAGTRLKILEAMAAGVPVISSQLGAEGLAVTPDRDILFAEPDDAAAWIRQVSRLASGGTERPSLTEAALDLVRTRYDWAALGAKLAQTYQSWLGRRLE
jgi:glycosyltransferase involved in cell wall biosynthesis